MKKLTLKQAITWCRDLWKWMEKTKSFSSEDKEYWPGWKNKRSIVNDCPCCHYSKDINGESFTIRRDTCKKTCPLISIWPVNPDTEWFTSPCLSSKNSPYKSFACDVGTPEDARKIWQECERLLKEME